MLETQTGGDLTMCGSWSRGRMREANGFIVVNVLSVGCLMGSVGDPERRDRLRPFPSASYTP